MVRPGYFTLTILGWVFLLIGIFNGLTHLIAIASGVFLSSIAIAVLEISIKLEKKHGV